MSKILDLQASAWTREDLPGYHVRYTLPDDAAITLDGQKIGTSAAPVTAAGAAIAAQQGGYVSDLGQMVALRPFTDAQGRLVDPVTRKVITEPENTDPWPTAYGTGDVDAQVAVLLQFQFDHPYRRNQINIDGRDLGQPGDPTLPKVMFTTAGAVLRLRTDAPVPIPVPVAVLPVPSSGDSDYVLNTGPSGQCLGRTKGLGTGTARFHLTAPTIASPTKAGHFWIVEAQGSERYREDVEIDTADGVRRYTMVDLNPSISWSTLPGPGIDCVIPPDMAYAVSVRHADPLSSTAPADILIDVKDPA